MSNVIQMKAHGPDLLPIENHFFMSTIERKWQDAIREGSSGYWCFLQNFLCGAFLFCDDAELIGDLGLLHGVAMQIYEERIGKELDDIAAQFEQD